VALFLVYDGCEIDITRSPKDPKSFLEPLRPYLLGAAILLFGFSFWRLYLKKPDCSCDEDFKARKIARGIFWVGAVAFVFSASFQRVLIHLYQ
jgi:hypothetical protein